MDPKYRHQKDGSIRRIHIKPGSEAHFRLEALWDWYPAKELIPWIRMKNNGSVPSKRIKTENPHRSWNHKSRIRRIRKIWRRDRISKYMRGYRYKRRYWIQKTSSYRYKRRYRIHKTSSYRYKRRYRIQKTSSYRYKRRCRIHKTLSYRYKMRYRIHKTSSYWYKTKYRIQKNSSYRYKVKYRIQENSEYK